MNIISHSCRFFFSKCRVQNIVLKLDESTAHRHLKSPQSLSGRPLHLILVTKWSQSWSSMTYSSHPLRSMSIGPPILRYSYFRISPWKILGQGHACGQRSRSHLTFKIQKFRSWPSSNPLVTFDAGSSIEKFACHFLAIGPFLAEI